MPQRSQLRIGTGAGFSADRLDPAVDLVRHGGLDVIVFECVGERTLAFGHRDRQADPAAGYNPWLERRMRAILPLAIEHGTRVITNMGVANPAGAAERTATVARDLGLSDLRIAAIEGDDVSHLISADTPLPAEGTDVAGIGRRMIGANAYLGADALLPALEAGADVIITGRTSDPALFLAPIRHAFGWADDDWPRLGAGTLAGHLMECAAQITGGYFADPAYKDVAGLARIGFPIAEVGRDGALVITKLPHAGGCVTLATVKEQLLYEVHDPGAYVTPDVVADFSSVRIEDQGDDRVRLEGATGAPRPDQLKVTVAFDGGHLAEAEISYAGAGAIERARLAGEIVAERMAAVHGRNAPLRVDLIGVNALHGTALDYPSDARDVRLRCAMRAGSREEAELLLWEVESLLCCGPAGGGGYRGRVTASVMTHDAFIERTRVRPSVHVVTP